jgi:hypothetical protein
MEEESVFLIYYRCNDDISLQTSGWWLRWLTSKITKSQYIHVEMRFEDKETYGIVMGEGVSMRVVSDTRMRG